VAGEYIDEGVSGAKDSRPELNRLMADAHKRRFDVVFVWRFDRFARSVSHLLRALETFKALGIDFVSFSEQMDTSTPAGKMVFTVLGAVEEPERSLTVERVRAGLRNACGKGKTLGRPRVAVDSAKITSLRTSGAPLQTITRQRGISPGTAKRAFYSLVQKLLAFRVRNCLTLRAGSRAVSAVHKQMVLCQSPAKPTRQILREDLETRPRRFSAHGSLTPLPNQIFILTWHLGAVGRAATLALASVLAFATIVAHFAAAFAFAGVLTFACMLFFFDFAIGATLIFGSLWI
jgi:DNA invertase Pin-like site-specific DNA recombinase